MHAGRTYVRRELHAAEAEAATLMGQLVWDASQRRDHDTAVGYFDQAIDAARERGDRAAEGLATLRKSFVALYGWRDPKAGLALTQRAARITAAASQVMTGLAVLHTAEAYAMLRERRECEQALSAADAHFGQDSPLIRPLTCSPRRNLAGWPDRAICSWTTRRLPRACWNRQPRLSATARSRMLWSWVTSPWPTSGWASST